MKSVKLIINISLLIIASQSAILTHQHRHHIRSESKKMSVNIGDGVGDVGIEAAPGEDAHAFDDTTHVDQPLEVHNEEDDWDLDEEHNEFDQAELDEINEEGGDHHLSFPEDVEEFENRQKLLLELIEKLNQVRTENIHVAQVELEVGDVEAIEGLLKGFYDLREHDQSIAIHGGEEEEDEEEDWYNDSEHSHEGEGEEEEEHEEGHEHNDWDEIEEHEHDEEEEFWHEDEHENGEHHDEWDEEDGSDWEHEHDHEHGEGHDHEDEEEWELEHEEGHDHENEEEWELEHEEGHDHEHGDEEEEEHNEEDDWEHVEEEIVHDQEIADTEHEEHETGESTEEEKESAEKEFLSKLHETKMSYDDLTQVSLVVDGLMKKYNNMFLDFPKEVSTNTDSETQELESTYEKIKEFIHDVVEKRDSIHKEIDFLKEHFNSVKYSREEVLDFYSYKNLWEELDHHADSNDENWIQKKKILDLEVTDFVQNVKEVLKNLNSVNSLQELIWSETQFVRDQMNSEKSVTVKEKVVGLPTLIQKMVEIKFDIDKDLNNSVLKITQIKEQKSEFMENLTDMSVYLGVDKSLREGSSIMHVYGLTLFLLAFFLKF